MLYTIIILISGIYIGQEYQVLPSMKIIITNLVIYLRNLKDPIETIRDENITQKIYEKIIKMVWW